MYILKNGSNPDLCKTNDVTGNCEKSKVISEHLYLIWKGLGCIICSKRQSIIQFQCVYKTYLGKDQGVHVI